MECGSGLGVLGNNGITPTNSKVIGYSNLSNPWAYDLNYHLDGMQRYLEKQEKLEVYGDPFKRYPAKNKPDLFGFRTKSSN